MGKVATLAAIAEQWGDTPALQTATNELRERLEKWLSATDAQGNVKSTGLFAYDANWGTLIGYPASFGSDTDLNDHHFHYGYFLQAAAEVARRDRAWAADGRWGGMVRLLIRDIASPDRSDALFPFLRNFDPYEGHTWASGNAKFGDGNNNESSSEAMNAWTGLILWAEATGDHSLRDLGVYLYTTEMEAIDEYWFDIHGRTRPSGFPGATVGMVWGGKAVPATWFSGEPEKIHGINWLPFHGGSLYLGQYPEYVQRNYDALVKESGGLNWRDWVSYVLMYEALADPADALRQLHARFAEMPMEEGNSRANLYHWVHALDALGQVGRAVTADCPTYAVFHKGPKITHVAYNPGTVRRTIHFSDGASLAVEPGRFAQGP
jgi:endoglucanase Acf2